jgi:hypothetical protein
MPAILRVDHRGRSPTSAVAPTQGPGRLRPDPGGWSWQDIAQALGVSKQAVDKKHAGRGLRRKRHVGAQILAEAGVTLDGVRADLDAER